MREKFGSVFRRGLLAYLKLFAYLQSNIRLKTIEFDLFLADETEMLDVSEKGEDADLEKKRGSKEDAEKDSDKSGGKEKGVSEFLKEEEDRQKEEAERLANEIREEKERKEREEAERARAKKEAERLEKVR